MKLPNIWFGWMLVVGLIVISSVSATQEIFVPLTVNVKLENIVMMREHALNVSTITLVPSMVTQ